MKKSLCLFAVLAVLLSSPLVFTSCGSDSVEDEVVDASSSATRIEISFSDDYAKFSPYVAFDAFDMKGKGMTMTTSDGEIYENWVKSLEDTGTNTLSAQIKGDFSSFTATFMLTNTDGRDGKVTVKGTVYENEKVIKTETLTVNLTSATDGAVYNFSAATGKFTKMNSED